MSSPGPESVSKHTVSRRAQKKPERNKTKQEGKIRPFVRAVERKGFGDLCICMSSGFSTLSLVRESRVNANHGQRGIVSGAESKTQRNTLL